MGPGGQFRDAQMAGVGNGRSECIRLIASRQHQDRRINI